MGRLQAEGGLPVRTTTLDSLIQANRIDPPHCIKMDIEGTELLALQGARETFQQYHPILFLATHGWEVHRQCCRLLESWGYAYELLSGSFPQDRAEVVARYRG